MDDDFIRSLQGDWQSQDHDAAKVLRRLHRNRWTPHIVLGAEILVCALALLVGLWFAWVAARNEQHKLLFALSAGVLLLTAPALCVAGVRARRHSLAWDAETPESLLQIGIRRAESSLRAIRIGRWHIAIVAAFVITLWVVEALGFIHSIDFLILYTTICLAVSIASWLWMMWREKHVRREHAACVRLLAMLKVEDE
ncbi:hypothetical protein GCM10011487_44540 [Steroidobacter agaridevorans]|uniref:Uncharacterized protein n=1 Tax=Steroidobacter agaridevorans TaxID=2695856 RepID=A0A829YGS8_9GAMM|nr:hypothetical protein [Steroidobacter agaridevorans]GFE82454.1 hypothetical protein GCM10011487_44540 [Steroidobacter agaridevorans]